MIWFGYFNSNMVQLKGYSPFKLFFIGIYFNSNIVQLKVSKCVVCVSECGLFQFQYSTIKSIAKIDNNTEVLDFNSNIVQLKVQQSGVI